MTYQLIYADPPWEYNNRASNGAAADHYQTTGLDELKRLPVWTLAAPHAVLAMWYTGTHAKEAEELASAWGFRVRQRFLFTWVKLTEQAERTVNSALARQDVTDWWDWLALLEAVTRMNGGNYSRQNQESVLIAVRGAGLLRQSASVKQIVYSPISGEHSGKPGEVRCRLEQLYGDVTRIELFSRGDAPGWHHWGNEAPHCDIELMPGEFRPVNDNNPLKQVK